MAVGNYKPAYLLCLKAVTIVVIAVALGTSVGCNNFDRTGTAEGQSIVGPFQAEDENPFKQRGKKEPSKRQQVVQLTVYRIIISPEGDENLGQLWSLLRPAQLITNNKELLSRNGLQVAAGSAVDWPKAIALLGMGPKQEEQKPALIADTAARLDQRLETWLAQGLMAELPINNRPAEQTLFWHQPDGRLVGKTYQECHKVLVVTAVYQPTGQIHLQMMPALKKERAKNTSLHWLIQQQTPNQPERYVSQFEALALAAVVNSNEFLAISRSAQASDASFGAVFFRADNAQQPATTVLLLVPQVITKVPGKGVIGPDGVMQPIPNR